MKDREQANRPFEVIKESGDGVYPFRVSFDFERIAQLSPIQTHISFVNALLTFARDEGLPIRDFMESLKRDDLDATLLQRPDMEIVSGLQRENFMSHDLRVRSAQMQQFYSRFLVTTRHVFEDESVRSAANLMVLMENLSNIKGDAGWRNFRAWWSGVRGQSSVMEAFAVEGFDVMIPNPFDKKEVERMDVKGKTDFVAVSSKEELDWNVDAKSDASLKDPVVTVNGNLGVSFLDHRKGSVGLIVKVPPYRLRDYSTENGIVLAQMSDTLRSDVLQRSEDAVKHFKRNFRRFRQ